MPTSVREAEEGAVDCDGEDEVESEDEGVELGAATASRRGDCDVG